MEMAGNTILVTGATSGIGQALAEAFYQRGNKVIIAGRRQSLLDSIVSSHPGMTGMALDVSEPMSVEEFVKAVRSRFPGLNVLVNNAGIYSSENYTVDPIDMTRALEAVRTNIIGVLQLSAALLPTLRSQPHSTLLVTTSGLAFVPYPPGPVYGATKAFLHSWLDAVRMQLRHTSVEVLELVPPYVQTELGGPQQAQDPHAMPLGEYVREVIHILGEKNMKKGEILVDRVRAIRSAERDGKYEEILESMVD